MTPQPDNSPICWIFRVHGDPSGPSYLGPAVLLDTAVAILTPDVAGEVRRTGLDAPTRYWLAAGAPDAAPESMLLAPVTRMRVAEEPDFTGVHHVAVGLDLTGWQLPVRREADHTQLDGPPCTAAEAEELRALLASATEPDPGWIDAAAKRLAEFSMHQQARDAATVPATNGPRREANAPIRPYPFDPMRRRPRWPRRG